MNATKQDVLFAGTDQRIYLDASRFPTSVISLEIWEDTNADTNTPEDAIETGPELEGPVQVWTLDGDAGDSQVDPTSIPLDDDGNGLDTIVPGRSYLLVNAYGDAEWVEIARVDYTTANTAWTKSPILANYTTADALISTRITATLSEAWCADTNNLSHPLCPRAKYRAVWTYYRAQAEGQGTLTLREVSYFDLVRYPFQTTVTAADVDALSRGWLSRLATEDRSTQGATVIREAVHQVKLDLWERDMADYALRNQTALNELIRLKAVTLVHEQAYDHGGVNLPALERSTQRYWDRMNALIGQSRVNQQVTESGSGAPTVRAPIGVR